MICFLCLPIMTSCSLKKLPDNIKEVINKQSEEIVAESIVPEEMVPTNTPQPTPTALPAQQEEVTDEPVAVPSESTPSLKDILKDILKLTVTESPEPKETEGSEPTVKPTATEGVQPTATPTVKSAATPMPTPKPTPKLTPVPSDDQTSTAMITPPPIGNNTTIEEYAKLILSLIINDNMNDVEKVKAVHDYIVLNTEYDQTNPDDLPEICFTIEGVLIKRVAVCQGYAYTFQLFMDLLDITSNVVVGTDVINGVGHAWNMVYLGEKWYMVDTTWDDPTMMDPEAYPDGILRYNYFLMPDSVFSIDHKWNKSEYPVCSSEKYIYYIYEGNIISSIDDYEAEFIKRYKDGQRTITLLYPEEGKPSNSFMANYDYLLTKTETGFSYSWSATPPWRLGDYTVFTVEVD